MKAPLLSMLVAAVFSVGFFTVPASAQVPQLVNYQGRVAVGTVNFDGPGSFKFALVDAAGTTTFWSNDGTSVAGSQPTAAVALTVTKGLYSVLLGDTTLANMTAIPASVWTNAEVRLRVWFNDGTNGSQLLTPDQRLAPNGYLPDGSVAAAALASGAVNSTKIASGAVGSTQIAAGAVQSANIAAGAVAKTQLANSGITITAGNTSIGRETLFNNTTGTNNTALGNAANVVGSNLTNATVIGAGAFVDASNKVRLGNTAVTAIHGQVGFTATSDRTKKENFRPVDGAEVLRKIRGFPLTSWNFIGHDPKEFRHYGPMAQDFYAAFGQDAVGTIGTETTINNADLSGILLSAVQALDQENAALRDEAAATKKRLAELEARLAKLEQFLPETRKAGAATAALKKGD